MFGMMRHYLVCAKVYTIQTFGLKSGKYAKGTFSHSWRFLHRSCFRNPFFTRYAYETENSGLSSHGQTLAFS